MVYKNVGESRHGRCKLKVNQKRALQIPQTRCRKPCYAKQLFGTQWGF